jgi:hypothetical protein
MDLLSPEEVRVLGCLLEKESTTPDQYPLSLNALTSAVNQKSARDPVMSLRQEQVQDVLDGLVRKYLVSDRAGFGGRVKKYKHRFCNTEFGSLQFSEQERAALCVLMLRGPQTPGEIRSRTHRLAEFADTGEVETALQNLAGHESGPFAVRLPREPGKREARYAHLLCGEVEAASEPSGVYEPLVAADTAMTGAGDGGLAELERRVAALEAEVAALRQRLDPEG